MTPKESVLDFSAIRELWSEYKVIKDGTIVKVKTSISEIIDTGEKKGKSHKVKFNFQNQFYKQHSSDDKGEPSETTKTSEEDIIEEVKFEKIREPICIYDVPDKLVLVTRTVLKALKKTRKFNAQGNRIYNYEVVFLVNQVGYPT